MRNLLRKINKFYQKSQLRKEYTKLRLEAMEANKLGDIKRSLVLDARADRMIDQVIYF